MRQLKQVHGEGRLVNGSFMPAKKRRKSDVVFKAQARTEDGNSAGVAQAFGGGNLIPAWQRRISEEQARERHEERLRLKGGPTGEQI